MKQYKCRVMNRDDPVERASCQALCEKAQHDYWLGIKAFTSWSLQVWERIQAMRPIVAIDNQDKVVGFLLMSLMTHWKPPTVKIYGWASDPTLSDKERICVGLSMLLYGYDDCVAAGITQGVGDVTYTDLLVIETLRLVKSFKPDPPLTDMVPNITLVHDVKLKVSPSYQRALKTAIRKL